MKETSLHKRDKIHCIEKRTFRNSQPVRWWWP